MIRGETFTVALVFDSGYDTSRVEDMTLSIGNYNLCQLSRGTMTNPGGGQTFYGWITGEDTAALSIGERPMVLAVWDSQDGVRKAVVAIIPVQDTGNLYANETTGELANLVLAITYNTTNIASEFVIADIYMGAGLPAGGAVGLPLVKKSTDDFDAQWSGVMSGIEKVGFAENPTGAIASREFRWDAANGTFAFGLPDGGSIQIGQEDFDFYTNVDTVPLTEGMPVSSVSIPGNRNAIKRTDPTRRASAEAFLGLVTVSSIAVNGVGRVTLRGEVSPFNTSSFAENATLYVTGTGNIGTTEPAAGTYKIIVGTVAVSANNGTINVNKYIRPKLTELSDVDGPTTLMNNGDKLMKQEADGVVRFITYQNVKADLKNVNDALYEPILGFTPVDSADLGQPNGVATLDGDGLVPASQLPSYVDDVIDAYGTYTDVSDPNTVIELWTTSAHDVAVAKYTGKIYVDVVTRFQFRWTGSVWAAILSGPVQTVAGKTGNVLLVKGDVGLSNVDNTSDVNKPISTSVGIALSGKVGTTGDETIAGVKTFSSSPIVPAPTTDMQAATKAYADGQANAALTLAQKYAENPEDVEVVAGEYSAKHWAAKAEESALNIQESEADMVEIKQ